MAKTIFKYKLTNAYTPQNILAPPDLVPLDIQLQSGIPHLWCEINQRTPARYLTIQVYGTGWDLPDNPGKYLGTWHDEVGYVYHAYLAA